MSASLAKGQNGPLAVNDVVVSIQLTAPADLSALLVTEQGKVRTDADFVFFNQPSGPGVNLVPAAGGPAALAVSLAQVPPDIAQIRAVITLEDSNSNFGRFPAPTAIVSDTSGNQLFEYRIDGLASESIVIALELYRRQGAWKVRAVGQGYAGGFAALVTDHGVSVDDSPAPQAQSAPPPPPPAPTQVAQPTQGGYPPPQQQFAPTQGYPPPQQPAPGGYPPPQQGGPGGYPPPPQQGGPGGYPPPPQGGQQGYPPPPQQGGYPQQQGHPQGGYPPAAPPQQPPAEVSLSKDRPVSLEKGQRVTLRKEGGAQLTFVKMGLGWDPVRTRGMFGSRTVDIDLDASVTLFADTNLVDVAYYGQLSSKDGSVRHQGDNLTGEGDGDDEVILVDLTRVPAHVNTLLFIVTSYKGHSFEQVQNAFCRLVDGSNNAELARFTLAGGMPFTAMAMAKIYRAGNDWKFVALGEGFQAKHPGEAVPQLGRFLVNS
ncbi:TerD family protein [Nocardia asteroides]|uniref:TerD family protein n=1 Tax=Nocardia asteroides TaxID=1824 RepID=UPI001E3A1EA7|nr:TerD family protein [Nocardia asteroides]UGT59187.1 TerD family protein [Nocardia asteroides]